MNKVIIEYQTTNGKNLSKELAAAILAVLQEKAIYVSIDQTDNETAKRNLFSYGKQTVMHKTDNKLNYQDMIDSLYNSLLDQPFFAICEENNQRAFESLKRFADEDTYMELEDLMSAGFAANTREGFRHGFQCAAALLTGKTTYIHPSPTHTTV